MSYEAISQISMQEVLDKLGIKYSNLGFNCLGLWEDGKLTDGWRVNVTANYINDFSKDRPHGSPYIFLKMYLKLCDKDTFQRFADNFGIENKNRNKHTKLFKRKREPMKLPKYYSNW